MDEAEAGDEARDESVPEPPRIPQVDLWLVDGFNTLHAVVLGGEDRGRFWDRDHRERLIRRLAPGFEGETAPSIVLVFDGDRAVEGEEARPAPGLEVVFAPSADDWIVKRTRRAGSSDPPERVGVVTGDRQVAGRCRHAGAEIVAPAAFMAQLRREDEAEGTEQTDRASQA